MLNNQDLKNELLSHVIETLENIINYDPESNLDELHFKAFNEDYYIIGYYQASEWLKKHNIDPFDAIAEIIDWENNVLGESNLKSDDMNSERVVNLLVYILGEQLLSDYDLYEMSASDFLKELKEDL